MSANIETKLMQAADACYFIGAGGGSILVTKFNSRSMRMECGNYLNLVATPPRFFAHNLREHGSYYFLTSTEPLYKVVE